MVSRPAYDAVVVGAGPNGLAAAITLARAGRSVLVVEAAARAGGSVRSETLLSPDCIHDPCSGIFPLALASACLRALPLESFGLRWLQPPLPLAHPFDDGTAAVLEPSLDATAKNLGTDGKTYRDLMYPVVSGGDGLVDDLLGPLRWPQHLLPFLRFAWHGLHAARAFATRRFESAAARGLFAGLAAHSVLPLERPLTAAIALLLGSLAHRVGWPIPQGGARALADALVSLLQSSGGEIVTGTLVQDLRDLPRARVVLLDLTPRQILRLRGTGLPSRYVEKLQRFRYGPGVCKLDWILDGPVPWRNDACTRAGTVHVGGTLEEIAAAEAAPWRGEHAPRPFVLLAQPSLFDATRAPAGKHTLWAYCHVPHASQVDMTAPMEAQIERFAPGFRARIVARHVRTARDMEEHNPNLVGGDIGGGVLDWRQLFTRPTGRLDPYVTPVKNLFLCSASTPPGGGVHGLCGYFAARRALRRC